ncbi:MAG: AraC family transcriptional regulator [Dokdonella sp.]
MHPIATSESPASARPLAGIGRVLLWKGGSVWIGRDAGLGQPHNHHAIQITLALIRPVCIRGSHDEDWQTVSTAIVMPDRPHQFDGCGQAVATVFVEPETRAGRALIDRYGQQDISLLSDHCLDARKATLHAAFEVHAPDGTLISAAQNLIEHLADASLQFDAAIDHRIGSVLERIRDRPDGEMSLAQAASVAHLSPSRFRHLFVAQTGISFRAYLLWARVEYAIARGMAGGSWTEAAQQAGFADSAHFSRTCRRMFGVSPTMVVREAHVVVEEATPMPANDVPHAA